MLSLGSPGVTVCTFKTEVKSSSNPKWILTGKKQIQIQNIWFVCFTCGSCLCNSTVQLFSYLFLRTESWRKLSEETHLKYKTGTGNNVTFTKKKHGKMSSSLGITLRLKVNGHNSIPHAPSTHTPSLRSSHLGNLSKERREKRIEATRVFAN